MITLQIWNVHRVEGAKKGLWLYVHEIQKKKTGQDYILTFKISLHYIELGEQRTIVKKLN